MIPVEEMTNPRAVRIGSPPGADGTESSRVLAKSDGQTCRASDGGVIADVGRDIQNDDSVGTPMKFNRATLRITVHPDTDQDGRLNSRDLYDDNDGLSDAGEVAEDTASPPDATAFPPPNPPPPSCSPSASRVWG